MKTNSVGLGKYSAALKRMEPGSLS